MVCSFFQFLLAQSVTPGIIEQWLAADNVSRFLSVLAIVQFFISWFFLRLYIKEQSKHQELILKLQERHDQEQKELHEALRQAIVDSSQAITILTERFSAIQWK